MALYQGYFHKEWTRIQYIHYMRVGIDSKALNIDRWKKMFCTILGEYCLDCWHNRNEVLHGKELEDSKQIRLERIKKIVKGLYKRKGEIKGQREYRIFRMPIKKRLKMGIQSNTIWTGMAQEVLKLHRERMTKNTIHSWLQPR